MQNTRHTLLFALSLGVLLLIAWLAYAPGLHGTFLFDDFANLPALGSTGPIHTRPTFWRYITSGTADPTGRPLALLSFLLDARDWPASPFPFKRTSVLLHLFNAALLALLLRRLGQALLTSAFPSPAGDPLGVPMRVRECIEEAGEGMPTSATPRSDRRLIPPSGPPSPHGRRQDHWRVDLAALLGAAFWLLHPLLVSTTLYIVQREAMLPATFTLLGLLLWLHGRTRILRGQRISGVLWMLVGLGGCTVLGVLSKANGVLLPALALVIEYTVLRASASAVRGRLGGGEAFATSPANPGQAAQAPQAHDGIESSAPLPGPSLPGGQKAKSLYRRAMLLLAWLPTTLVALYLLEKGWQGLLHGISATRPWTLGQRLLTEPRVLMDYLGLLWIPRPFTPGLFNDHIHASVSLLSPASTLPALIAVLGLIIGACLLRKRWPTVTLALLFYFVGQSLESSTIPLELYFEHRNYLPAMLMFWPLALWLCGVRAATPSLQAAMQTGTILQAPDVWAKARLALAVLLIVGLTAMTWARASLWGNAHDQALLWAQLNPQSPRAQVTAAQVQMNAQAPARAAARLQPLLAHAPDEVQLALNLFAAQCQLGHVDAATLKAANIALRTSRNSGTLLTSWFGRAISHSAKPPCAQLNLTTLDNMLDAALTNPNLRHVSGRRQDLYSLKGNIALARHDGAAALINYNHALDQQVRYGAALQQAAMLGSHGFPALGLVHLEHFDHERHRESKPGFGMPSIHAWVLRHQHYWQNEESYLRATLRADAARTTNPSR